VRKVRVHSWRRVEGFYCFVVILLTTAVFSHSLGVAGEVSDVIHRADELRLKGQFQESLVVLNQALQFAEDATERGIILGKQAEICAFDLKEFRRAEKLSSQSLQQTLTDPVSVVIALKTRAHCEMEGDKDFDSAKQTLLAALKLPGVEWAKPTMAVMLGDCYRQLGDFSNALESYKKANELEDADATLKATAVLNCGLTYLYDLGKPDKARMSFVEAVRMNPLLAEEVRKHLNGEQAVQESLLLAHYMPWYAAPPRSETWGWHWTMNHFDPNQHKDGRREIASKFYPLIGPYDSGDRHVIEYHLLLMKLAGIDGVVIDWYGRTECYDYRDLHENVVLLVSFLEKYQMKFVICYEDQTINTLVEQKVISQASRVSHATSELKWLAENWFQRDSYVRFQGQPALLSFGHGGLNDDEWQSVFHQLDLPIRWVSEHTPRSGAFGAFDWPIPEKGLSQVRMFSDESKQWQCSIPVIFPRFVDVYEQAGVQASYAEIEDNEGKTFRLSANEAGFALGQIVQVATWNDWGEGTQIEPSVEFGYRDLESIQSFKKKHVEKDFQVEKEALRLPRRLLALRQAGGGKDAIFDEIAKQLLAGEIREAEQMLHTIESDR